MATTLTEKNQEYIPANWEEVSCPFCNNTRASILEKFGPENRYKYVRCEACHLAYLNPRPRYDNEFVSTAYDVYSSSVEDVWQNNRLTAEGELRTAIANATLAELERFSGGKKGRMLEIGCHYGIFSKTARDRGWDVMGVDISPSLVKLAREVFGLNAIQGNWLELNLQGPFDLIYCSHTIEHIPNPSEWLAKFRDLLAPKGRLCLEVPNMDSADRVFKRFLKRVGLKKSRWDGWRTPDHLYEPCEISMLPFLERNGYRVLKVMTYSRKKYNQNLLGRIFHDQLRLGTNLRIVLEKI